MLPPDPCAIPAAGLIDWNEAWQAARARTNRRRGRESWDKRAPSFARAVAQNGFIEQVLASVEFVSIPDTRRHAGLEDALEGFAWMLTDPTPDELASLRDWVTQQLVPGDDGWRLAEPGTVRWAILSWKPGGLR